MMKFPRDAVVRKLPGEEGIWLFVLADMSMFAVFFGVFLIERSRAREAFETGRQALSMESGAINTVLLLTSSLMVVYAVNAHARNQTHWQRVLLVSAVLCGIGFVIVKLSEWARLFSQGVTPSIGGFFGYYFMFTGIHLAHVVIGIFVLIRLAKAAVLVLAGTRGTVLVEAGAIFWHMIDLLWMVLFPLFYLMH